MTPRPFPALTPLTLLLLALGGSPAALAQQPLTVRETVVTDYRPVVARLESSDMTTARARVAGTVSQLSVDEGSQVRRGQVVALVTEDTLAPQTSAADAQIAALRAQLKQLEADFARALDLHAQGFYPTARLDAARTGVDVARKQLASAEASRRTLSARKGEGAVLAPADARVTEVLVVKGSVVSPGEVIARLATSDGVVRLSLPERHAGRLKEGETVSLRLPSRNGWTASATISKIYPELRDGAVIADAKVEGGADALVGERVDVLVPVGERRALRIPASYVETRYGVDFVRVRSGDKLIDAPVALSDPRAAPDGYVEVLSGLREGDVIEQPRVANAAKPEAAK